MTLGTATPTNKEIQVVGVDAEGHVVGIFDRRLVGMKVKTAIKRIRGRGQQSIEREIHGPYKLNDEPIDENSERVIAQGDVLTVDP